MPTKLILTINLSVTSEDSPTAKIFIDPDAMRAEDVILVECPRSIDPKALDVSKIIQGSLPGIIEEHNRLWHEEYDRLKAKSQPSLLEVKHFEA